MKDPAATFAAIAAAHARCVWLDGAGGRDWSGRRSLLGWLDPDDVSLTYDAAARVVRRHAGGRSEVVGDDVFAVLQAELATGPADARWFGYLGYACRPDLPAAVGADVPDAVWMRPRHVHVVEAPGGAGGVETVAAQPPPPPAAVAGPPPAYAAAFGRVQEELRAGNTYEVNLTYRQRVTSDLDPVAAYLRLRALNPAPYAGLLQHDVEGARAWLLSSSPERFARIDAHRVLETRPIKGTTLRPGDPAADPAADADARERLATDPKTRAENLMIVDLLRNDVSLVCEPGTVEVPGLMEVESYEVVHQLVSTVRGRLRDGVTTLGALRALFPAGSMTGAPKLRTMQIIEDVEDTPRGAYAGAFGWLGADGRADLGVVIRSLTTAGEGVYTLGTGGGITVRSTAAEEWAETRGKADRLLRSLAPG